MPPTTTMFWLDYVDSCSCCLASTAGVTDCYLQVGRRCSVPW
jgi:hypothetical protein